MKNQRPKNLNLFTIRFPISAIVSILHRISGVILFLFVPFALWGLSLSLSSEQDFSNLYQILASPWVKIMTVGVLAAFIYHFVAGIRHLLMDIHIGETLVGGRWTARVTILISVVLTILAGMWIW